MTQVEKIAAEIIALERAALDRWGAGDPSGYLEISAPDVSYFDPFQDRRIDGLAALTDLYESIRGSIYIDRYDLINPHVLVCGYTAVLTFNLASHVGVNVVPWNCTEVYRRDPLGWRIVQTHWSITQLLKGSS